MSDIDDVEDSGSRNGQPKERRKIEIKFIENKTRRHVTFSKRKHGIMKKAFELSVLTGTQVLLLVVSETGLVYTFSTPKFEPIVTQQEGRNLIQACLNAPDDEEEEEEEDEEEEARDGVEENDSSNQVNEQQQREQQQQQQQQQQQLHHQQQQQQQQMLNNTLKQEGMKTHSMHPSLNPNHGIPPGAPGGSMTMPQQTGHQPHPGMPHPHLQGFPNASSPYLNPEQNAVYQQYFQESQQGQY
ncbi:hypothetical protein HG537_0D01400 [Torulaspora globosa]|uniref:MADS-box domain-containing protein n=1 Tax=Torulaspora globosa TaxID=48254 RepID=A0A7H9HS60_9SACH|nr:hypothetical protein HG537_0D01400 [Torulaspora sp. CBS 2947]